MSVLCSNLTPVVVVDAVQDEKPRRQEERKAMNSFWGHLMWEHWEQTVAGSHNRLRPGCLATVLYCYCCSWCCCYWDKFLFALGQPPTSNVAEDDLEFLTHHQAYYKWYRGFAWNFVHARHILHHLSYILNLDTSLYMFLDCQSCLFIASSPNYLPWRTNLNIKDHRTQKQRNSFLNSALLPGKPVYFLLIVLAHFKGSAMESKPQTISS